MLRSQLVFFLYMSLLSIVSARAVDRRQLSTSEPFNPETVTHVATEIDLPAPTSISVSESSLIGSSITTTATGTATNTKSVSSRATVVPTDSPSSFDDHGEYIPPPPPDEQYYQDEGADGDSTGFINVSIGAQAGIIIGIVLVGLAIMGGCVWFWKKKQAEWKAALERRRTLRASRVAAAKAAGVNTGKKDSSKKGAAVKKPSGLSKMSKNGSSSTILSTEVKPVDVGGDVDVERSQFDVMTPTESENPSWWKKVLPKKK